MNKETERLIEDFFWYRKYDRTGLYKFLRRKQGELFGRYLKRLKEGERIKFNHIKKVVIESK